MPAEFPDLTSSLLAARDGDRLAMSSFIRATQAEVWRLCRRLGDEATADDLTQDTYVRAMRALPSFRGDASARTWLLAIARNTCADAVRANRRRRRRDEQHVSAPTTAPDHAGADAVERLIADLDLDRRAAFVLTQVLGLGYAEAAEVCDVPVGTIRSRVARARDELVTGLRAAAEG